MEQILIGDQSLFIKDYYCDDGFGYLYRDDGKLWLYINVTDVCNGRCPFCINPCRRTGASPFDISSFRETLIKIKNDIYGVSITGGEPMLQPELIDDILTEVRKTLGERIEIDMVTNGVQFERIVNLKNLNQLNTIHVSRHHINDEINDSLFGFHTVAKDTLKRVISELKDPGMIVFNCALIKGYIDNIEKISQYLEFAAEMNVQNTSFIGLSICNEYCKENFIDPADLDFRDHSKFHIWNTQRDHEYCKCCTGNYEASIRPVRFYYRCIGKQKAEYTRQLVYTADNRLLAGFSGKEIIL